MSKYALASMLNMNYIDIKAVIYGYLAKRVDPRAKKCYNVKLTMYEQLWRYPMVWKGRSS